MAKALIVSLGGTPEPIIKSIETHRPDYLYFYSSQDSNSKEYPNVKNKLDEAGMNPKIESVIVDDVNDLVLCYEKANEIATKIEKEGIPPDSVIVDYTGGTKNMSAALMLATVTKGYSFSYVGGKERTKDGLGIVVSGTEEVKPSLSPWQVLLVEERKKIGLFFNSYQFSAARDISEKLSTVLSGLDKAIYKSLSDLIEGYRLWDSFEHRKALLILEKSKDKLREHSGYKEDKILSGFLHEVNISLELLKDLSNKTRNFKETHISMVFDLFCNAKRRAKEGKYDDGVARLYRALEMIGQIEFEKTFDCSTSDVNIETIPELLREEIKRKHTSHDGKIKVPLYDAFLILKESGNSLGLIFFEREEEVTKILSARNDSILAHGVAPIAKEGFEKFSSILEEVLQTENTSYKVEFPKILWQ